MRTRTLAGLSLEDDAPLRPGDVIAGRYRVDRVIGVGGMGIVFAGMHLDLEQPVAIKLILPSVTNTEGLRERFLREARAAARLRSEHVTKVLDVGQLPSGAPYMVMELLEGCDLAAYLATSGPLPAHTAAAFIAQACEAVAEAHAQGIVHRDIKPQNLFLTTCVGGDALVKVLDFGVSKVPAAGVNSLTKSMVVMGSPLYMSPEQMRSSRDVDGRTDIWALGVVLFELLAGRAPFDGESIPALCLRVAVDAPPSLAHERPDLPPGLAAIVMRCLEKQRENRYQDVGELAAALAPFVTSTPSVTIVRTHLVTSEMRRAGLTISDAPVVSPTVAPPAKSARIASIVLALVACAAIAGTVAWRHVRSEGSRPERASAAQAIAPVPWVPPVASAPSVSPPQASVPPAPLPLPAPSAYAAPSASPPPAAKPRAPRHAAPRGPSRSPSRPPSSVDDIPSMRTSSPALPAPASTDGDIPTLR